MNAPQDPQIESLKVPPHSVEAEQSVLGGLLLDNAAWDRIADFLSQGDFYRYDHRIIYEHIGRLIASTRPADVVTVYEALTTSGKADDVGGLAYLNALAQNTPSAANIRRYAEIVRDRAVLRRLVSVADEISADAFNPQGKEVRQLLDEAESKVFSIAEEGARGNQGFLEIGPLLTQVVERIDTLYHTANPSDVTGTPTGFVDLDRMTSGMHGGELIIVAGRPSMGKAQPLDARVRTLAGWKRMGELAVGDQLASADGAPSAVTGIYPQGERQVYRVRFSDGRSAECCDEHLWCVHYREWAKPRILSTAEIRTLLTRERYRNRLWIDMASGDFGHTEALPVDPWVLGALLGDGSMGGTAVRFSVKAEETLERMRARVDATLELEHAGRYDWRIKRRPAGSVSRPTVNPLKAALERLGVWGRTSYDKFIPREYLDAGKDARLDLLRGLLDTDGWVESWGTVRYSTASPQLARDVQELARSLGAWCQISEKATSFTSHGQRVAGVTAYVCTISHPDPQDLFLFEGKRERLASGRSRRKMPVIVGIEPTRRTATQCISVSHPSRLYVTDDYVVTHNTAFSMNIGEYVAVEYGLPVAVFSMEMPGTQLVMRMLGSIGRLDQHRMRTGRLTDEDWPKLTHAVQKMSEAQLFIDETGGLNPMELRSRARRLARQCGKLGLIIVDYLQLMSGSSQGENRATEISEISRSLKSLAKELDVPVIALSQLNRGLEQRPNKRPVMSDLRESGAIEQDADVILFIYRDEVYNPDSPDKGTAEIIIGKQRNGPIGPVRLTFLGQYTKFDNFAGAQTFYGE
ncbi:MULTISPECIES: replicative DNA helicase [Burkholderia]|uniref:Replicative DNA helicase n=1 Tax=Burkholderia contaminans TaxID=488447 RepID=A0A2S5DT86_9BURK|nr:MULTISPECIES: replicative DNA helicase [Burkholderia]EKS9796919.1 replicative DNA helicase [Burkholderia cepacia]EKS9803740.1 replicative DNA helicase [Burkholderia cepacia]EKS9815979.1 replicative DNA helicase [Burkholderia cepacia]EKS9818019.1 replicative DNA helicase [Burkholderia cepacia]EKS9831066.1 replicative DNA helicase [Burkholderia cepacia]